MQRAQELQNEQRRLTNELARMDEDTQEAHNQVIMIEPRLQKINGVCCALVLVLAMMLLKLPHLLCGGCT